MTEEQLKEFRESLERVRKIHAATPEAARKFLEEEGFYTASGELTEEYRTKP